MLPCDLCLFPSSPFSLPPSSPLPRYMNHADILAQYDAIMVLDDDIEIEGTGINRLFELREEFNLWAIAPSFKQPYVEREEETKRRGEEEEKRSKRRKREEEEKRQREEEREELPCAYAVCCMLNGVGDVCSETISIFA